MYIYIALTILGIFSHKQIKCCIFVENCIACFSLGLNVSFVPTLDATIMKGALVTIFSLFPTLDKLNSKVIIVNRLACQEIL